LDPLPLGDGTMKVTEIFYSIEGEGIRQGYPCVFIRLAGCNLKCSYCDSEYSRHLSQGVEMSEEDILKEVLKYDCPRVTITGGEPYLTLTDKLLDLFWDEAMDGSIDIEINIETNGSLNPSRHQRVGNIITMDYKLPSSGMEDEMTEDYVDLLRRQDVLKFVVGDLFDMARAKEIIDSHDIKAHIFFSPVYGRIEPSAIADYLKANKLDARLQLQIHKIIWNPDRRGV